ncbi:hypothetical protein BDW62DRAFT_204395 [Aspergillus aurantiobrunneus]
MSNCDCDCDCDYELYLGVTPHIDEFGTRWVIMLLDPDSQKCNWYQSRPEPNGDARSLIDAVDFRLNCFTDKVRVGTIQEKDFLKFLKIFGRTQLSRSHLFAARFLANLAREGLVEHMIAQEVVVAATYPAYKWTYLDIRAQVGYGGSLADREESCIIETASRLSLLGRA